MQKEAAREVKIPTKHQDQGEAHKRSIHIQCARQVALCRFIFYFSQIIVSHTTFCRFHSQQSKRERKKSTVIDLKAFSHYVMKVHTKKQAEKHHHQLLFIRQWNLALWW